MTNLRELAESDLADTLEDHNGWGLPVVLKGPDGETQEVNGQILYNTTGFDPQSGAEVLVHKPVATVRISSLDPVPQPGEAWAMGIPITPDADADKVWYIIRVPHEDGNSIGFMRLYGTKIKQSEE